MKSLLLALLFLSVSVISGAESRDVPEDFLLQREKAGRLKVGATVDELNAIYRGFPKNLVDLDREGFFTPAIEIYLQNHEKMIPSLVAEFRGDEHRIHMIKIIDQRFKTEKGVGVGSTLGDVKKAYRVSRIEWDELGFFAQVEDIGMAFILDAVAPPGWAEKRDPGMIPDDAKVISIILG
ncbi:MAG: hypothetical protein ACYC9O_02905 [Candidatus Latescibacterota bacterium]